MSYYGFQTPLSVAEQMVDLIDFDPKTILEPSSGTGNLLKVAKKKYPFVQYSSIEIDSEYCKIQNEENGFSVHCSDFFYVEIPERKFDLVLTNPPHSPMEVGYKMIERLRLFSDRIIAIMPWLWIINSWKRWENWKPYIRQINHLPRSVFPGSRIQTAIFDIDLSKSFSFAELS